MAQRREICRAWEQPGLRMTAEGAARLGANEAARSNEL